MPVGGRIERDQGEEHEEQPALDDGEVSSPSWRTSGVHGDPDEGRRGGEAAPENSPDRAR